MRLTGSPTGAGGVVPACRRSLRAVVIAAFCLLLSAACPASAAPGAKRTVLVLSSDATQMPGLASLIREVTAAAEASSTGPVSVDAELLDRTQSTGDDEVLLTSLGQRHALGRPDLVVALAAPCVEFVLRHRDTLFRGVPLLYAFTDARTAQSFRDAADTSGVAVQLDYLGLVDLALKLHPRVRHLVVVGGSSAFDRAWQDSFRQVAGPLAARVSIRYLTDATLAELLGEAATLPDDSLILYLSMTRDRAGEVCVPRDVLAMLRRVSRSPVYGPSITYVGRGAVGGPVIDLESHGRALGRMVARLLAGEPVGSVTPEVTNDVVAFDSRELARFGISEASLPPGSRVLFRRSDWQINRNWVVAIAVLIGAEAVLIAALVLQRRTRTTVQQRLDQRLMFGTLLADVSTALNAVPLRSIDATIRSVLERVRQYFDVDAVAVLDASSRPVVCRSHAGTALGDQAVAAACQLVEEPVASLKLASFQPFVLSSLDDCPGDAPVALRGLHEAGVQSLGMMAMEVGGQNVGVLCCLSRSTRTEWTDQMQQLRTLAEVIASALQRQQTATAVAESDRLRGAVLSSITAQISVLDRQGKIIAVNDAWTAFGRANGVRRDGAILAGADYLAVCRRAAEAGAPGAREALEGIQAVCEARRNEFELAYRCDAPGVERWFDMRVRPLRRPEGGAVVTHHEITDERRHEIALRESEERFRTLADALPLGIWVAGAVGDCVYVNRTWLEWTGRTLERELGDGWKERVHASDVTRVTRAFNQATKNRQPFSIEFRLQRRDGAFGWVLHHVRPRYDDAGTLLGFVGGCIDITERLESQARLRELHGRLINAQEQERRRMARELHDDLQQRLALLAIELEGLALGQASPLGQDVARQVRRLFARTNEISNEVHRMAHRLLPAKLETLGLLATVDGYCREIQQTVRTVFSHRAVPAAIPDDVALCMFRVLQEALGNVIKHSGAAEVHVELTGDQDVMRLTVTDSGRGFDLDTALAGGGLGLIGMRERLRLVGGDVKFESAVGAGARIEAVVPLRARPVGTDADWAGALADGSAKPHSAEASTSPSTGPGTASVERWAPGEVL
jgi:PAS domain S-box-containing protein